MCHMVDSDEYKEENESREGQHGSVRAGAILDTGTRKVFTKKGDFE